MTNEEIKTLADGYYAGNADWLNKEQEQDTKVGWRQGFAYALRQFAVRRSFSLDEVREIILEYRNACMYGHSHKLTRLELQNELRRIDEKYDLEYKEGIDYIRG